MKYKPGDKVRIIANTNNHGGKIGQVVTLLRKYSSTSVWVSDLEWARNVRESDIEPLKSKGFATFMKELDKRKAS